MLTNAGHGLVLAALALLTLGLGTANPLLIALTALPLTAFILGLTEPLPRVASARLEAPVRARAGDTVDIQAHVTFDPGDEGLIAARVSIPDAFDLVEGSNVALLDASQAEASLRFKVRAARRGRFTIGPLTAAPVPLAGVRSIQPSRVAQERSFVVNPGVVPLRRLKAVRGTSATLAPEGDEARVGLKTTDFRELRGYRFGDPPRTVNWKATARLGPAMEKPLVNEYEVEGRKAVWFMLDAGQHMAVGTTVENGFEMAVTAVSGLALSYVDRGYKVGFYAYNTTRERPLFPDVGAKQFRKLQQRLSSMAPGAVDEGPLEAVVRCRSWLMSIAPMVVFVTRTEVDTARLEEAIRRIRSLDPLKKRPVLVVEPQPFHLVPGGTVEEHTSTLLEHMAKRRHERLRALGAIVVPWNPEADTLERLLFEGVGPRG